MTLRSTVIPAFFIILQNQQQIFLLQRKNTGYHDGSWTLPAGHIERGETAQIAGLREAKEEAGVIIIPENLKFVHINYRLCEQKNKEVQDNERVDFYFQTENFSPQPFCAEKEKATTGNWFDLKNLPHPMVPCVEFVLDQIYNKLTKYSQLKEM